MEHTCLERVAQLLEQAISMQAATENLIREAMILMRSGVPNRINGKPIDLIGSELPYIDQATLSVRWQGLSCDLGATIPMRFFERLCRRPYCFVCHENLLQDVWAGARKSQDTVRSTVRRLTRSLENAGMNGLAQSIRCQGGRYALMLR
jgi:hypothetical protein